MSAPVGVLAVPTPSQALALHWPPGEYGYAELQLAMVHAPWVAVRSAVNSCRRRGWLDEHLDLTDAGRAALARCTGATP